MTDPNDAGPPNASNKALIVSIDDAVQYAQADVKLQCTAVPGTVGSVEEPHIRLKWARLELRGILDATSAARKYGWNVNTYRSHENGTRPLSKKAAYTYARRLKVNAGWLLYGQGQPEDASRLVRVVGYIGAGDAAHFYNVDVGDIDEVESPPGATLDTVAVRVRGDSMAGEYAANGSIVYFDERREPPTDDLITRLCIVELKDGRTLIKRLFRGSAPAKFHLVSPNASPMFDEEVIAASPVIWIRPA